MTSSAASRLVLCVFGVVFPLVSAAQVGRGPTAATRAWGNPSSGQLDSNGQGVLTFTPEQGGLSIRGYYDNSICRRMIVEMDEMTYGLVNQLLAINADGRSWELHAADDEEENSDRKPDRWLRSDERFLADLRGNTLEIRDIEWASAAEQEPSIQEAPPTQPRPSPVTHRPTAERPAQLPSMGASSREVQRLLGTPSGTMTSGDRVAWYYAWGLVWLQNDRVVQID